MNIKKTLLLASFGAIIALLTNGCNNTSQERQDRLAVDQQQAQYAKAQPIPMFRHSLERELVIKLYKLRNEKVATHTVWRSDYGMIEGDCPSIGYGIPYDTSLTNPLRRETGANGAVAIGQAEPNGVFASTNTAATWVMCIGSGGNLEPHYVESKVTVYPYSVTVDYAKNRVKKAGEATATISK